MLTSASDATFADLSTVNLTLLATIFGTVRNVFERNLSPNEERAVQDQLIVMCNAYLEVARNLATNGQRSQASSDVDTTI